MRKAAMAYAAFSSTGVSSPHQEPCSFCGRTFNPESLARHQPICQKSQVKKRRVFNSGRQRADGTDISITKVKRAGQETQAQPVKITNWRQNHSDFVNSIRSARAAQKAIRTGGPLPPPPPPSVNPNYIECPHCLRRFNQSAGARHIPVCGERTRLHGAPVKPLHKRAAADVGYSTTGIRKAYDNRVVRRKGHNNPYAFAQQNGNDPSPVPMYSTAYGGRGATEFRHETPSRRSASLPPRNNSNSRQGLSNRLQQSNTPTIRHRPRQSFQQTSPHDELDDNESICHHNGVREGQLRQRSSGARPNSRNQSSRPVRSAVAGSRPKSGRPKSSVRFADKLERFEGQDPPSPREPHPPPYPPPTRHNELNSHVTDGNNNIETPASSNQPPGSNQNGTSWYGNQGTNRTTKASEMRLHRGQMPNAGIRTSPRLSQESGSPRDDSFEDKQSTDFEITTPLQLGQRSPSSTPPRSPNSPTTRSNLNDTNSLSPSNHQRPPSRKGRTNSQRDQNSNLSNGSMKYPGSNGVHPRILASLDNSAGNIPAPFCFACGTQYPVLEARFCCGCGIQRAFISETPS